MMDYIAYRLMSWTLNLNSAIRRTKREERIFSKQTKEMSSSERVIDC